VPPGNGTHPHTVRTLLFVLLVSLGCVGLAMLASRRTRNTGKPLVAVGFLGAAALFVLWVPFGAMVSAFE
jgi:hypothetical protein